MSTYQGEMCEREKVLLSSIRAGKPEPRPTMPLLPSRPAEDLPTSYHLSEDPSDADLGICSRLTNGRGHWLQPVTVAVCLVALAGVLCALRWPDLWWH